jgi:hypothetical protein
LSGFNTPFNGEFPHHHCFWGIGQSLTASLTN